MQKKLTVGPARDRYEAEADHIADRVTARAPAAAPMAPPAISRLPVAAVQRVPAMTPPSPATRKKITTTKVKDPDDPDAGTVVQRSADGPSTAPAAAEHSIGRMRAAGGRPMPGPVRQQMEGGMGRNLSGVRIHDGAGPAQAARSVGARAFTVGNDVFFGAGHYRPDAPGGQRLLAHELVHTQQQKGLGNMAQAKTLQREPDPEADTAAAAAAAAPQMSFVGSAAQGRLDLTPGAEGGTFVLPEISIPTIQGAPKGARDRDETRYPAGMPQAYANHPDQSIRTTGEFTFVRQTPRGASASSQWRTRVGNAFASRLAAQVDHWGLNAQEPIINGERQEIHFLRLKNDRSSTASSLLISGREAQLGMSPALQIPLWTQSGNYVESGMQVDHVQELQLGGEDSTSNFWLFAGRPNASSGGTIRAEFDRRLNRIMEAIPESFWASHPDRRKPDLGNIKMNPNWRVRFGRITGRAIRMQTTNAYWTLSQILGGEHLDELRELSVEEVADEGLITHRPNGSPVTPSVASIFTSDTGGFRRRFRLTADGARPFNGAESFFPGFDFVSADINPDPAASPRIAGLNGWLFRRGRNPVIDPILVGGDRRLIVNPQENFGFGGYIRGSQINDILRTAETNILGASPVSFQEAGIDSDGTIYANGTISATKALFPQLEVPIYIRGTDIFISFPIPTDRLSFGPVSVTEAALNLGVGEYGVYVEGVAGLAVDQLGTGSVQARVENGNTIISGTFNFNLDFLDPASAQVVYNYGADTLTLTLNAGVGDGKLPGVRSGEFTATFSRDAVSFSGSMVLGGALDGVVVTASYSQEAGLRLGADNIQLPVERIPGVSSATASLYATRNPETGEWTFGGAGTAALDIAGATGEIAIGIDGDRVVFGGNLAVAKGAASGTLRFTATNAPIDEDGNPVEGEVSDAVTVFGRGDVAVTFGRILRGTAGIELTPVGNIILRGTIGLPPTFDVFPRQDFNRTLLHVETPDFPVWGVSLGGVGIGIFAFSDADLSFNAFVGPGQLVDTQVGAEMDLDRPEDATITGQARFVVPAYAGFRLDIGGGLRARAAVAFVEGRVGLDAELGIAADAAAAVDVAWNRADGLSVSALVEANAQPKFRVGVNASVTAGIDLVLTEISKTWGPWRKTLGEFGPEMSVGVTIPVGWNEATGMNFSMDDIVIRRPEFSVMDILKSSFEELV